MRSKHKIASDTHANFIRNIETLKARLSQIGHKITDMKLSMKTFNNDYDGYVHRYKGVFWSESEAQNEEA